MAASAIAASAGIGLRDSAASVWAAVGGGVGGAGFRAPGKGDPTWAQAVGPISHIVEKAPAPAKNSRREVGITGRMIPISCPNGRLREASSRNFAALGSVARLTG